MKRLIPVLLSIILLSSCGKAPVNSNVGCIEQDVYQPGKILLPPADQARALQLFAQNKIPTTNLQFYKYNLAASTPAFPGPYETVFATCHYNGLPLFFSNMGYSFLNGVASQTVSYAPASIDLDNKPKLNLDAVRAVFLDAAIKADPAYSTLKDSCLVAQFGYHASYGNFSATTIVKAWKVTIKTHDYPALYLKDDDGTLLFLDVGMRPNY